MPRPTSDETDGTPPRGSDGGNEHPLAGIDQVLHSPARLMIATHLFVVEAADAVFLRNMTNLTWGNLSAHLRKLEDAGYVAIEKSFNDRKPRTAIALTDKGRAALREYRAAMLRSLEPLDT